MIRHCRGRQELHKRIQDGEIGDIIAHAGLPHARPGRHLLLHRQAGGPRRAAMADRAVPQLHLGQRRIVQRLLRPSDRRSLLDEERLAGEGASLGRPPLPRRLTSIRTSTPTRSSTRSTTASSFFFDGRTMIGCRNDMSSVVHGTKGSAIVSTSGHIPARCGRSSSFRPDRDNVMWAYPQPEESPYVLEWKDLIEAIVHDKPYNEVPRGVEASLVTSMGRMAAHTGQEITYEQMLNCPHEMAPGVADFATTKTAPLTPDDQGRYPRAGTR